MIVQPFTRAARPAAILLLALLAACAGDTEAPSGQPSFYRTMAATGAQLLSLIHI